MSAIMKPKPDRVTARLPRYMVDWLHSYPNGISETIRTALEIFFKQTKPQDMKKMKNQNNNDSEKNHG